MFRVIIIREYIIVYHFYYTGLICFCIGFGIVLSRLNEKAPLLIQFFGELSEIVMALVNLIMWLVSFNLN